MQNEQLTSLIASPDKRPRRIWWIIVAAIIVSVFIGGGIGWWMKFDNTVDNIDTRIPLDDFDEFSLFCPAGRSDNSVATGLIDVYIHTKDKPTVSQIVELEKLGAILYLDSWIPPLKNHPTGFFFAKIPFNQISVIKAMQFIEEVKCIENMESYPS